MTSPNLERLAATGELKVERFTRQEFDGLMQHTAGLNSNQCRLFSLCHQRRNKAEYEGEFDIEETLVEDLRRATDDLLDRVSRLPPGFDG